MAEKETRTERLLLPIVFGLALILTVIWNVALLFGLYVFGQSMMAN